jgi:glycosyltransferase involved in cell wall biosynthesis
MKQFDAGIVSISKGVSNVAYPSKSIMYMSVGLPIFAVLDTDSELATMLNKEDVGVAVTPEPEAIASGIKLIADNLKNGAFSTEKIKNYAESEFGKDVILNKIVSLIMEDVYNEG